MIFFLYGADTFRSRRQLFQLKDKFIHDIDPTGMNIEVLEGAQMKAEDFFSVMRSGSLFVSKRMVIVENVIQSHKSSELTTSLAEFLKKNRDTNNIVIFYEEIDLTDKKKKTSFAKDTLLKLLLKEKHAYAFDVLRDVKRMGWIQSEFSEFNVRIRNEVIRELMLRTQNDSWVLHSEIQKLGHYANAKHMSQITFEILNILVQSPFDDNIFALIDALSADRKSIALRMIHDRIESGENPLGMLSLMIRQFRLIMQAKRYQKAYPLATYSDIASVLSIHPFVAKKITAQLERYSFERLEKIYSVLFETDIKSKSSAISSQILFSQLVFSL